MFKSPFVGSDLANFIKSDLCEANFNQVVFENNKIDYVVHLAAQAGVRYSIENPSSYIQSNLVGFSNILEVVEK